MEGGCLQNASMENALPILAGSLKEKNFYLLYNTLDVPGFFSYIRLSALYVFALVCIVSILSLLLIVNIPYKQLENLDKNF